MLIINNPEAHKLYRELQNFSFDETESEFSFLDRLADENAWRREYATGVLEEYRRFLVLFVFSGHPVSPSDEVDQVWHLHLLYTRSYWRGLCGDLLGRELHHIPTEGGEKEKEKFMAQYAETLDSYEQMFGEPPPKKIWPKPEFRFSGEQHFRRIDVNRKPISLHSIIGTSVAGVFTLFAVTTLTNGIFGFVAMIFMISFLFSTGSHYPENGEGSGGCNSGCGSDGGGCGGGCGGGDGGGG